MLKFMIHGHQVMTKPTWPLPRWAKKRYDLLLMYICTYYDRKLICILSLIYFAKCFPNLLIMYRCRSKMMSIIQYIQKGSYYCAMSMLVPPLYKKIMTGCLWCSPVFVLYVLYINTGKAKTSSNKTQICWINTFTKMQQMKISEILLAFFWW